MDNTFNPEAIEQSLYAHWEKEDFFKKKTTLVEDFYFLLYF